MGRVLGGSITVPVLAGSVVSVVVPVVGTVPAIGQPLAADQILIGYCHSAA